MLGVDGFFQSWWGELIMVTLATLVGTRIYTSYVFSTWKRKGVASCSGYFPCGNLGDFIFQRKSIPEVYADIYKKGEGHKLIGYYSFLSPSLVVRDPELIRLVLVKDFAHFTDRGSYINEKDDPLSAHVFALDGERWKSMRSKLSPTYTSGKMKFMFDTMRSCGVDLQRFIVDSLSKHTSVFESKDLMSKYGLNVIAKTAIGLEGNNFRDKNLLSEMAFKVTDPNDLIQSFRFSIPLINRNVAAFLRLRFTPKETSDYYMETVRQIVEHREKTKEVRNDFMQLLLDMDKRSNGFKEGDGGLTLQEIAAQTFVFILAGHETTSSTIAFGLHEIALNPHIQEELQNEIDSCGFTIDDITYDKLLSLKYLDMVMQESLRKYPPAGILIRECVKDYTFPDGFEVKAGTRMNISVTGLHHDPKYFPDPEKFDPERFNKDSPSQKIQPFSYLPFGDGPRFCIGMRFAKLSVMLGLFSILSKFTIKLAGSTEPTIKFNPALFLASPKNGLHIQCVPRIQNTL